MGALSGAAAGDGASFPIIADEVRGQTVFRDQLFVIAVLLCFKSLPHIA